MIKYLYKKECDLMIKSMEQFIKIENIVKGCGIKNLKIIDPAKQAEFIKTIKQL